MTAIELDYAQNTIRRVGRKWLDRARRLAKEAGTRLREQSVPAFAHIREHGYTMCGLSMFSTAGFVHSPFTGFLVLGASFIALELKVRS